MASARIVKVVFVLSIVFTNTRECYSVDTRQGSDQPTLAKSSSSETENEIYDGVPTAAETEFLVLQGRKMLPRTALINPNTEKESLNIEEAASKISSPTHFAETFEQKNRRMLSEKPKLTSKRGRRRRHANNKMEGLMAFSADYRVPRPHPPRHN